MRDVLAYLGLIPWLGVIPITFLIVLETKHPHVEKIIAQQRLVNLFPAVGYQLVWFVILFSC